MKSEIYPRCCGLNIIVDLPRPEYSTGAAREKAIADLATELPKYEKGQFCQGHCTTMGNAQHLRAHIIVISEYNQTLLMPELLKLGYRELGRFTGPHGVSQGYSKDYKLVLLGKGFDEEKKDAGLIP